MVNRIEVIIQPGAARPQVGPVEHISKRIEGGRLRQPRIFTGPSSLETLGIQFHPLVSPVVRQLRVERLRAPVGILRPYLTGCLSTTIRNRRRGRGAMMDLGAARFGFLSRKTKPGCRAELRGAREEPPPR